MKNEPIRLPPELLRALAVRSTQTGEPVERLVQRYVDEGIRLDRHPEIFFRDGPSGRRAVVRGGPDVWQVIIAARGAPERGDALIAALVERIGVPVGNIRIAIRYYAEYPEEVDRFIEMNEEEADRIERVIERERRLIGG